MYDRAPVELFETDPQSGNDELLSSGEAAKLLGVTPQSVRNFYNVGRLQGRKIDGTHYFKKTDVVAFGLTRGTNGKR